jgi:hypothetical protein
MSPDDLQSEHVNGTRDQFFLLEELCGATLQPCEGVSEIACIFKERFTALTRPRSNKVARTKNDFLQNAFAA